MFIFFYLVKTKPLRYCIELLVKKCQKKFRSLLYLDFELLFLLACKTGGFAILSNRRFNNKTAVKIVIKYKFKSRN